MQHAHPTHVAASQKQGQNPAVPIAEPQCSSRSDSSKGQQLPYWHASMALLPLQRDHQLPAASAVPVLAQPDALQQQRSHAPLSGQSLPAVPTGALRLAGPRPRPVLHVPQAQLCMYQACLRHCSSTRIGGARQVCVCVCWRWYRRGFGC